MNGKKGNHRCKLGTEHLQHVHSRDGGGVKGTPEAPGLGEGSVSKEGAPARRRWRAGDSDDCIWVPWITGCTLGRLIWQQNVELAETGSGETS